MGRVRRPTARSWPSTSRIAAATGQARRGAWPSRVDGLASVAMKVIRDPGPGLVAPPESGRHDRRLRRRPRRAPRGDRAGAASWPPSGARDRGRHLRPPPGQRRAARVGAPAADAISTRSSSCSPTTGIDAHPRHRLRRARSKEPAEDFVREVLVGCLRAQVVVVGDDFHFGHQRQGNVALLRRMGGELGFEVVGLDLVGTDHRPGGGGRPGVVHGHPGRAGGRRPGRGHEDARPSPRGAGDGRRRRRAGPRARLPHGQRRRPRRHLPARRRHLRRLVPPARRPGPPGGIVARAATRPSTRTPTTSLLEAHLLDFDGDLYGEPARVRFVGPAARRA